MTHPRSSVSSPAAGRRAPRRGRVRTAPPRTHRHASCDGAARHHRLARRGRGPRRRRAPCPRVSTRDVLDAQLGPDDLHEDGLEPLAALDGGGVDRRAAARRGPRAQRHARLGRVVEPLAVGEVLVADREPDAAPDALAAADVPGAAGKVHRVAGRVGVPGGSGIAAQRSITSRAGAEPRITWPVGSTEPVPSGVAQAQLDADRSRAPRRACPSAPRARSTPAARRTHASPRTAGCSCRRPCRPGGRSAPRTGPARNVVAFAITAGEEDAYAPPSISIRASTLTSRPSRVAVCRIHIRAGCRFLWAKNDSRRPYVILTGRPVRSASMHACSWRWMSSRAPNAPPIPASVMRTFDSGSPRHGAICWRSTCSHCVLTNRSTPPSARGDRQRALRARAARCPASRSRSSPRRRPRRSRSGRRARCARAAGRCRTDGSAAHRRPARAPCRSRPGGPRR